MIFNSSVFFILFLAGTVFDFVLNQFLEASDFFFRKKHGKQIPERLKDFLNAQELEKTCAFAIFTLQRIPHRKKVWIQQHEFKTVDS